MFEPIPDRESAVDACARALKRSILCGDLPAGERLPPERQLAEQFGVNRGTIRSALTRLAAAQLLSVRQGSGYVVRDFRRTGGPDLLPGLVAIARERGALRTIAADILHLRRHLARAVLELLAERADDEAVAAVVGRIDRFAEAVAAGAGLADVVEADLDVLAAILDATGSAVLRLTLNAVTQVLSELPDLRDAMYAEPATNVASYRLMVAFLTSDQARRGPETIDAVVAELARRDRITLDRIAPHTDTP